MHIINGRRLYGAIEGDRDISEASLVLVQWCKDRILPVEKLLKDHPVKSLVRRGGEWRRVLFFSLLKVLWCSGG